jgi:hypothetical protein
VKHSGDLVAPSTLATPRIRAAVAAAEAEGTEAGDLTAAFDSRDGAGMGWFDCDDDNEHTGDRAGV